MHEKQANPKSNTSRMESSTPYHISLCRSSVQDALSCQGKSNWIHILNPIRGNIQFALNETEYSLNPGDLFLYLSEDKKEVLDVTDDAACYIIRFNREVLSSPVQPAAEAQFLFSFTVSSLTGQRLFLRKEIIGTRYGKFYADLLAEHNDPGICHEVAIRLLLSQFSMCILRVWKAQETAQELSTTNDLYSLNLLQKIFSYVDKEYMNKIKMETVADLVNMSYYSFSKFFINNTGKTFPGYVNEVRLTHAKTLLTTTGMSITEIGMEVGFFSTSRFIQRFKESNQMTPQQFRKEFNAR